MLSPRLACAPDDRLLAPTRNAVPPRTPPPGHGPPAAGAGGVGVAHHRAARRRPLGAFSGRRVAPPRRARAPATASQARAHPARRTLPGPGPPARTTAGAGPSGHRLSAGLAATRALPPPPRSRLRARHGGYEERAGAGALRCGCFAGTESSTREKTGVPLHQRRRDRQRGRPPAAGAGGAPQRRRAGAGAFQRHPGCAENRPQGRGQLRADCAWPRGPFRHRARERRQRHRRVGGTACPHPATGAAPAGPDHQRQRGRRRHPQQRNRRLGAGAD